MRSMYETRKSLNLTQDALSHLTGIAQSNISALERGIYKATQTTREKIERVVGQKIDWLENEKITLRETSYFKAERLLKKMVELTLTMEQEQKDEFRKLVYKYFKVRRNEK